MVYDDSDLSVSPSVDLSGVFRTDGMRVCANFR